MKKEDRPDEPSEDLELIGSRTMMAISYGLMEPTETGYKLSETFLQAFHDAMKKEGLSITHLLTSDAEWSEIKEEIEKFYDAMFLALLRLAGEVAEEDLPELIDIGTVLYCDATTNAGLDGEALLQKIRKWNAEQPSELESS